MPDILWIVTTQWRAQACGYAGDPNARTPALDALAADPRTVNYTQAVTPHPFGPFARAALLTGVASPENGVRDYWDALPREARTVAHALGERGYATAFFGKWGVGERDRAAPLVGEAAARVPVPREARGGFAHWVGFEGGFLLNDPWLHGDGIMAGDFERAHGYQSDVLCERAAAWLERAAVGDGRPRFKVVSLEAPHPPYDAPTPVGISRIRPEDVVLPANVPRGGEVGPKARRELAGYYAHIAATDAAIGRLLARLAPETIVVVTSVHGDMHGAHGLFRKGWPHEESVRVPLLVRGAPGSCGFSDEAVSLLDLPAMALAWSEGRAWCCGRERAEISMPCVVALPHQCDRVWSGWRSATEKAVFHADGSRWDLAGDRD
ncbi:MAG: sulfatase-like hydrolase/transferase [Opitutaceae bacterium]|nr:sulfatase-like hydrolase/transferase [Opitutaceae bacterium]